MQAERIPAMLPPPQGLPRSEGVHLSGLIRSMAVDYGKLDKKWVEDDLDHLGQLDIIERPNQQSAWWSTLDEPSRLRMSIGLAWEQWYLPQLEGVSHQPGEMQVDGIYMTHDGESLDLIVGEHGKNRHVMVLHEVKTTYKSINTVGDLSSSWLWLSQLKAYCRGLRTLHAYLHILYLCGDYTRPIQPRLHIWKIQFEQREIDEMWELLTRYVQHRKQQQAEDLMKDTTNARRD